MLRSARYNTVLLRQVVRPSVCLSVRDVEVLWSPRWWDWLLWI